MSCREFLDWKGPHSTRKIGDFWLCGAPSAPAVRLPCPAGRPDAVGGPFCVAHGGEARANREAHTDWNHLALECVGDADAVLTAGCRMLSSYELSIVIRPAEPRGYPGHARWTVAHGVGGFLRQVPGTWDSALVAERAAVEFWRTIYSAAVESITRARGGTLAWGLPIYARDLPLVVAIDDWVPGAGTSWGSSRDPLPEALALPFVAGRRRRGGHR